MNPIVILAVSGTLALVAVIVVIMRLREFREIGLVAKELEESDRKFSAQLSKIEEIIDRLESNRANPEPAGQATEESSDPHKEGWYAIACVAAKIWRHRSRRVPDFSRRLHADESPSRVYAGRDARTADYGSGRVAEAQWQREDLLTAAR